MVTFPKIGMGAVTLVAALAGTIAHFDVSIHQGERPIRIVAEKGELADKDGKVSEKECFGFQDHEGEHITDFLDTYGIPDDASADDNWLTFPIRGTGDAKTRWCTLDFDLDGGLSAVAIDLWTNGEF